MEALYRFLERPHGFRVEAKDRVPISVTMTETGFHLQFGGGDRQLRLFPVARVDTQTGTRRGQESFCNLIQYRRLVQLVSDGLMSEWTPRGQEILSHRIKTWALGKTRQAVGKRIHAQWRRLIEKARPEVVAVQKAVFAATLGDCRLLHEPQIYQVPQLVGDIRRYRAAASLPPIAIGLIRGDENPEWCEEFDYDPTVVVPEMSDWPRMYSYSGTSYRSLRRTLLNLPGGIPPRLLFYLSRMELERPVTDRVELLTLLSYQAEQWEDRPAAACSHVRIFMHATRAEIKTAMAKLAEYLRDPLSHRRAGDIGRFAQFISDYPENHRGKLSGLVSKAIRWHRAAEQTELAEQAAELGDDTETRCPPIPVPETPELKFLATVREVVEEGRQMQHCIATYAERAVRGDCFLFHCAHNGDCASVEVDRAGRVRQAYGPRNSVNPAVIHGKRLLQGWAADFPNLAGSTGCERGVWAIG